MEFLMVKAVVLSLLKELEETEIILKDIDNITESLDIMDNKSITTLLDKVDEMKEKANNSMRTLKLLPDDKEMDKDELIEEIELDIDLVKKLNQIKVTTDAMLDRVVAYI